MKTKLVLGFCILSFLASCMVVKPHEMVYLNDKDMQMGSSSEQSFEMYIESIREGSTPAGSSKSSGGCGCN